MYDALILRLSQDQSGFLEVSAPHSHPQDLQRIEAEVGPLPPSFRAFAGTIGSATLHSGETICSLNELAPLDIDIEGATGLVPLIRNANSSGDLLAFNPRESSLEGGEYPLYLISHDPLGVEVAAPSFGSWLESSFRAYTEQSLLRRLLLRSFPEPRHHFLTGLGSIAIGLLLFALIDRLSGSQTLLVGIASVSLFFGGLMLLAALLSHRRASNKGSA